ncbi:hypothetical protein LEP1GSC150_1530 [Leptospira interrogans serovar Copenhageni str. LT2050]|uniref:Uncharacterized protein n=1 Tax=Leptospira interrogans serovar Copenhageni str. LT2050 TaxID=1001598 RepID=M3HF42_LEPIT|nr:hypothetical protein LEP1GSC150_1530 [Leptospira interrogans serovar Copenhageni str. LT2050]
MISLVLQVNFSKEIKKNRLRLVSKIDSDLEKNRKRFYFLNQNRYRSKRFFYFFQKK